MAISIVSGNSGNPSEKVSDADLQLVPTAALAAGNYAFLAVVIDNVGTVEGQTETISVTDTNGNTWTRLWEESKGTSALTGVTGALFLAELNAELNTTDAIDIALTANATAKGARLLELSVGAGKILALSGANGNNGAGTTYSVALSGLANVPGLYIGAAFAEDEVPTAVTKDTAYTLNGDLGSGTAGVSTSNVKAQIGTLANTSTGDTYDQTGLTSADRVTILVRFEEADPPAADVLLAGAADGVSNGLGLLTADVPLVAAADGTSSGIGVLTTDVAGGDVLLQGNADGTSSGAGVLSGDVPLAGLGTGASSGLGLLSGDVPVVGEATGTSSGVGVLTAFVALQGNADGTSSGLGDITILGTVNLQGLAEGSSSGAGTVSLDLSLVGAADGGSSGLGDLTVGAPVLLVGTADGSSSGAGVLTVGVMGLIPIGRTGRGKTPLLVTPRADLLDRVFPPAGLVKP